ncbi:TetR/AcrR family transcriptional regulator [Actinokineospora enzanensis]|uniref:TetR/AcrR family transcriptional regulator n=1 Tax=Actinokineospora enzanensis TaxID=155975 RepID=UPI00036E7E93|nr:TetR/AcrR family transcriptional regulator [Actinokineospora enzanensis]
MSRRERYRAETRQEAKDHALAQLAEHGPAGISVNAIAHRMGLSGPALYRYFANRDALLSELISDGYLDLARTMEAAAGAGATPEDRVRDMAHAFRAWALAQPQRYLLLFGTPVPGYEAPEGTIGAAQRTLVAFARMLQELPAEENPLDAEFARWTSTRELDVSPSAFRRAVLGWTRLHGVLSLELEGHFTLMGLDVTQVYAQEVRSLLEH